MVRFLHWLIFDVFMPAIDSEALAQILFKLQSTPLSDSMTPVLMKEKRRGQSDS